MGAYDSLPEINAATLSGAIDIVVVQQVCLHLELFIHTIILCSHVHARLQA